MGFSLKIEAIAALLILLLLFYSYGGGPAEGKKQRWFRGCLHISLVSVGIRALSVWGIRAQNAVPLGINQFLSSLDYLFSCFLAAVIAIYMLYLIFEHRPGEGHMEKWACLILALFGIELGLVIANWFTGSLFYFADGLYYRGRMNYVCYLVVYGEVLIVMWCYRLNRRTASKSLKMAMQFLPCVICALVVFQTLYRDVMMNGMVVALTDLIIFISFQNSQMGTDYLTNLHNRGAFVEELSRWARKKKRFHVVMLSLNRFDQVNREFGQKNGDEFLYAVARYLEELNPCLTAYRVGNVNFAMLCGNRECDRVGHCLEEAQERFRQPWEIGELSYRLSASFSDLLWENSGWDGTQIIERLEYALQLAKAKGEDQAVHFDDSINRMMERQKYVIAQMKEAIEKKSYEVYFQPVYCWRDDLFCPAEALARLFDGSGKPISPDEFIPIAEESGMIREISWIIVEKVCAFISAHPELGLKAVSINMSIQQFMEEHMAEKLNEIIKRHGLDPQILKIEITERVITEKPERVKQIMEKLIAMGIGFYLDDFGVGYSNFSSVLSLPFDTIKLDKSLTDKLTSTEKERGIVRSMVGMFGGTYSIVAEGAETEKTVEELKKIGVDRIQGFYYSRPLAEADFLHFQKERRKNERKKNTAEEH